MKNIIFIFSLYAFLIIFITNKTNNYNDSFLQNFLVNANSSILDFFILGVILYYFEHKRQNNETIQELIGDLENLAKHKSAELNIMKLKIIRQLNQKGVFDIKIPRIELNELAGIKHLKLKNADLTSINMSQSYIKKCSFEKCTLSAMNINNSVLREVKFINCNLKNIKASNVDFQNVTFENCILDGGYFNDSIMRSCLLKGCDFKDVTYEGVDLRSANVLHAKNIDIDQIIRAKNLNYLVCDEEVKRKLQGKNHTIKFAQGKDRG
ncbi:pentapeptide repeat-containing protein [Enterobacter hormaechei]|nr:pentapeptide repeat-containing protein [Enterobacter hormaechei]